MLWPQLFIAWVIFGAFLARHRPLLRCLHVVSLIWGVLVDVVPGINFDLQRYDADFRFLMIRTRENAESLALYGGEADEKEKLKTSFANIWLAWWP